MSRRGKHFKEPKVNRVKVACIIIFFISTSYIVYYLCTIYKNSQNDNKILSNIIIQDTQIAKGKTERILQVEELKKENTDIVGWIEIENTNINYPVLQATDNDYYISRNYKKEDSKDGSIFLDKDYNWEIPSTNLLLYGHNNKNGTMFQNLMNYVSEDYYKAHPTVRFTTISEDATYEIISVFLSRVYYINETDVFRYYYFINANTKGEFDYYINESKKASLYDTGKTAEYGDQLLTLSTCEYSEEDGRLAVVLKKIKN